MTKGLNVLRILERARRLKWNRKLQMAMIVALVALIGIGWAFRVSDPVCQGKTLGEWFESARFLSANRDGFGDFRTLDKSSPSGRAIIQIGSEAVPFLMDHFRRENSRFLRTLAKAADSLGLSKESEREMDRKAEDAWICLSALGPAAEQALPELMAIASNTNCYNSFGAITLLGDIHRQPDVVVPVLRRALRQSGQQSFAAVFSLGHFGPAARDAVPDLILKWRAEKSASGRALLEKAIKQIDPGAAAAQGIQ